MYGKRNPSNLYGQKVHMDLFEVATRGLLFIAR